MLKKEIIQQIVENEQTFIDKLEVTLNEFKKASDLDEEATMDRQEMSQANEAKDMQLRMQLQYDKAVADLNQLQDLSANPYETAIAGSIIETDKAYFFMGTSLHSIDIENKKLYGVSIESPAFAEILGKNVSEHFTIGDTKYKIKEIL